MKAQAHCEHGERDGLGEGVGEGRGRMRSRGRPRAQQTARAPRPLVRPGAAAVASKRARAVAKRGRATLHACHAPTPRGAQPPALRGGAQTASREVSMTGVLLEGRGRGETERGGAHAAWTAATLSFLVDRLCPLLPSMGAGASKHALAAAAASADPAALDAVCCGLDARAITAPLDGDGWTGAHYAAAAGSADAVAVLLSHGAPATARAKDGATPLHLAAVADAPTAITALVRAGGDPGAADGAGRPPLAVAAAVGASAAVSALVKAGGDVGWRAKV